MRYTITHSGVPIGEVELDLSAELAAADVLPLAAYEAVRPDVQAATVAMDVLGFLGPFGRPLRAAVATDVAAGIDPRAALARGAALGRELELRDPRGAPVAVDWIEMMDFAGSPSDVAAWVRVRTAPAAVFAAGATQLPSDANRSRPKA